MTDDIPEQPVAGLTKRVIIGTVRFTKDGGIEVDRAAAADLRKPSSADQNAFDCSAWLAECPFKELKDIVERAEAEAETALRPDGSQTYERGDDARRKKWRRRAAAVKKVKAWIAKHSANAPVSDRERKDVR